MIPQKYTHAINNPALTTIEIIDMLKGNPALFKVITNMTPELRKLCIHTVPELFYHADNITDDEILLVLYNWGSVLADIKDPTDAMIAVALTSWGGVLKFVAADRRTEAILAMAVQVDPESIKYINNPSYELQKLAVSNDGWIILDIPDPAPDLISIAIDNTAGRVLRELRHTNLPFDMIIAAVALYPANLQYIPSADHTNELLMIAINSDPSAIKFMKNPSPEIQRIAIHGCADAIFFIEHQSPEIIALHEALWVL